MFSNKVKRTLTLLAKRKQCCASNVQCLLHHHSGDIDEKKGGCNCSLKLKQMVNVKNLSYMYMVNTKYFGWIFIWFS